jgi:hypothetical protein
MSTPFVKGLRKLSEKLLGTWAEGGDLPKRYAQLAATHAKGSPNPEWEAFAVRLAESAWKDAYTRGVQYAERLVEYKVAKNDPDAMAALIEASENWEVPGFEAQDVPPGLPLEPARPGDVEALNQAALDYARSRMGTGPRRG